MKKKMEVFLKQGLAVMMSLSLVFSPCILAVSPVFGAQTEAGIGKEEKESLVFDSATEEAVSDQQETASSSDAIAAGVAEAETAASTASASDAQYDEDGALIDGKVTDDLSDPNLMILHAPAMHNVRIPATQKLADVLTTNTEANIVHASTPEELVDAIAPDTIIVLEAKTYDLSNVSIDVWNDSWGKTTNGNGAVEIYSIDNFTIQGIKGKTKIVSDSDDNIFDLSNCNKVVLKDLIIGHDTPVAPHFGQDGEPGLIVSYSSNIDITDCELYGGWRGLSILNEDDSDLLVNLKNTTIRDCLSNILLQDAGGYGEGLRYKLPEVTLDNCSFVRNGYHDDGKTQADYDYEKSPFYVAIWCGDSSKMTITNCDFSDNYNPNFCGYLELDFDTEPLKYDLIVNSPNINNCTFNNNAWDRIDNIVTITFETRVGKPWTELVGNRDIYTDNASPVPSITVLKGTTVNQPSYPIKPGYIFTGWYKDKAFKEKFDFSKSVNDNMTLYAKWKPENKHEMALQDDMAQFLNNKNMSVPFTVRMELEERFSFPERALLEIAYKLNSMNEGLCHGISAAMIAAKERHIPLEEYNASKFNELNISDPAVKELISVYQWAACTPKIRKIKEYYIRDEGISRFQSIEKRKQQARNRDLSELVEVAEAVENGANAALLGFAYKDYKENSIGEHTVIVDGLQTGEFSYKGREYYYDVQVFDINVTEGLSYYYDLPEAPSQCDVYISKDLNNWAIPRYFSDNDPNAEINLIISDISEIDGHLLFLNPPEDKISSDQLILPRINGSGDYYNISIGNKTAQIHDSQIVNSTIDDIYTYTDCLSGEASYSYTTVLLPETANDITIEKENGELSDILYWDEIGNVAVTGSNISKTIINNNRKNVNIDGHDISFTINVANYDNAIDNAIIKGESNEPMTLKRDGDKLLIESDGDISADVVIESNGETISYKQLKSPIIISKEYNNDNIAVAGITLDITRAELEVNQTIQLKEAIVPENAVNKNVTWTSSDTAVATVSSSGFVKAVNVGTAVITVKTEDGGYTAECIITVEEAVIPVTSLKINTTAKTMLAGKTFQLAAWPQPVEATDRRVTWTSSNPAVATVSSTGLVTAVKNGTANITVKTVDGGFTKTCAITVGIPVTSVKINVEAKTIIAGKTFKLAAWPQPANASNRAVTWTSSDESVATVDSTGLVTAVQNGMATITAMAVDGGISKTCAITVGIPVTSLKINTTAKIMYVGRTFQLAAWPQPANAANRAVIWMSSNPEVATISASGVVKAVKAGTTTITAKTVDGGFTQTCKLTAGLPVTGVKINTAAKTIAVGKTFQLAAWPQPSTAGDKSVSWSSSNTSVVTVSSTGLVKGIKSGIATITVTTTDGGKTAVCKITVNPVSVTGVKLNTTARTITAGKIFQLAAWPQPSTATNKTVTWTSSNTSVATVSSTGLVKAVKKGTATITVKTADGGKTATCKVTVN